MKGYLNNDEATRDTIDDDGWLHTGDVAVVDEHHHVSIVDRVKELIKYKGFQVPPAELEALLIAIPKIADVAVIGVPDDEAGELPKAFVVPSARRRADGRGGAGLRRRARRQLQADPDRRVRRRDPEVGERQDPPTNAARRQLTATERGRGPLTRDFGSPIGLRPSRLTRDAGFGRVE